MPDDAFAEVLEGCVRRAVARQEEAGLRSITDGEFRRTAWSTGLLDALDGLSPAESRFEFTDASGDVMRWNTCCATGRLRRRRGITTDEFTTVRSLTQQTPKVTMPAPSFLHFFRGPDSFTPEAYPDVDAFWGDIEATYQEELADLARLGATYVQIDEVPLAMLCDPDVRAKVEAVGEDPERLTGRYIDAVNKALAGRPASMTVAMHLCRGNFRGHWMAAGGYDGVAERLFAGADVDAFFLEYDSERAGGFEPLRFVPAGRTVVLGLVSTKTPVLEEADDLCRRIEEAARVVPLERLALSPQCGFASTAGGNPLTEDDQAAKLGRVVDVAERVWGGT
jgi:5-methyltetrahydropteroyltriglutamate--homocysteine methyltransferase